MHCVGKMQDSFHVRADNACYVFFFFGGGGAILSGSISKSDCFASNGRKNGELEMFGRNRLWNFPGETNQNHGKPLSR